MKRSIAENASEEVKPVHKNIPHIPPVEERIERKISAFTSISMCALTVIIQIATSLLISILLAEYSSFVYALLLIAGAALAIRVYQRPGSPTYKLVWMCLLLAMPVSGMILFCLWGGTHQAKQLSLRKAVSYTHLTLPTIGG